MILLVLGRGKTGSLVAEVARQRGHEARVLGSGENRDAAGLTPQALRDVGVVIDFTSPGAVLENISACMRARKNMVVGTTGWYEQLPRVRELVAQSGAGLLYASNFSVGVNIFFDIARAAAASLRHGYSGEIMERHHAKKKDAPSGTAAVLQNIVREAGGQELEIVSLREGETVGLHELTLDSPHDTIRLAHDAKSRRGFAEGAVRAAEWLAGRSGFFDFREVWRELR
ncbi:MAG TPA: dihydrodipicolinate reductase C-terminal domain-containing protein [Terriglobales bacterium]|nr:dihydrodipicolinate reductase C-terminal domain-containing protein [Terriglobales bacterium]